MQRQQIRLFVEDRKKNRYRRHLALLDHYRLVQQSLILFVVDFLHSINSTRNADRGNTERQINVSKYRAFRAEDATKYPVQRTDGEVVLRGRAKAGRAHQPSAQENGRK